MVLLLKSKIDILLKNIIKTTVIAIAARSFQIGSICTMPVSPTTAYH